MKTPIHVIEVNLKKFGEEKPHTMELSFTPGEDIHADLRLVFQAMADVFYEKAFEQGVDLGEGVILYKNRIKKFFKGLVE